MDADDLRLFADSLRQAIGRRGTDLVDDALNDVDWRGALADDHGPPARVPGHAYRSLLMALPPGTPRHPAETTVRADASEGLRSR